jgi:hypothetical protein
MGCFLLSPLLFPQAIFSFYLLTNCPLNALTLLYPYSTGPLFINLITSFPDCFWVEHTEVLLYRPPVTAIPVGQSSVCFSSLSHLSSYLSSFSFTTPFSTFCHCLTWFFVLQSTALEL